MTDQEKINFVVDSITRDVYFKDGIPYMNAMQWSEMTRTLTSDPRSYGRHQATASLIENYPTAFNAFNIGYDGNSVTYLGKMIVMDTTNR